MAIAFDDVRQTYDGLEESRGRVKIIRPDEAGKADPRTWDYTRTTTFIDALTNAYGLMRWEQRKILAGIVARPALQLEAAAHLDDIVALDDVINRAKEAGKASDAANAGTAMHHVYEDLDRGKPLGPILERIPPELHADIFSRQALVEGLRWDKIESRVVIDSLRVTGTPDRIGTFPARHPRFKGMTFPDGRPISGKTVVVDDKTGKIRDYNILKVAMQLAVYSRSWSYDKATGKRTPHGADTMWALALNTEVGSGQANGIWIDLTKGWQAVMLCKSVREARNLKVKQLCHAFEPPAVESSLSPEVRSEPTAVGVALRVRSEIKSATTVEELFGIYELHQSAWTAELGKLATTRRQQIEAGA